MQRRLHLGDTWFVVSLAWWERVVQRGEHELLPAAARIHNDTLVDRTRSCRCCSRSLLKPGLTEGIDFRLVSERVWRALALEFGYDWEVGRRVVARSPQSVYSSVQVVDSEGLFIDLYPPDLQGHEGGHSPELPPETETDNSSPNHPTETWRQDLQTGQMLDALDTDKKWYEARVVGAREEQVKVHYRGWSSRWDEWIDRESPRLMPLHSKVRDWRKFQINDSVQIGVPIPGKRHLEWRNATVIATADTLLVQLNIGNGEVEWVEAQDERLCPPGTHRVRLNGTSTSSPVTATTGRKRLRTNDVTSKMDLDL